MRQKVFCLSRTKSKFQSTHPSWGATASASASASFSAYISIHAPIVGCDYVVIDNEDDQEISIHAPIVGCDTLFKMKQNVLVIFQSTHPSWGATITFTVKANTSSNFNPRTHRGVRHSMMMLGDISQDFNPRTHRGVRLRSDIYGNGTRRFQSTHPSWGATIIETKSK